jgi:selenocysteine lyase/cysteine desulfurase
MPLSRRSLLTTLAASAAAPLIDRLPLALETGQTLAELPSQPPQFPRTADFSIEPGYAYLNAAYTHPIPDVAIAAGKRALDNRNALRPAPPPPVTGRNTPVNAPNPRARFAALIGAKPTEIAYVSSTSAGENLVVRALGLDHRFDGNVVTDGLHFEGAIMYLLELGKRGLDVRIVQPTRDATIDIRDLERVIDNRTRLVEVSSAAMYNGFQHDLKAVCDLAHAHGAMVYADIVHTAGAEPFDVKASGVDFAACSSFKWLMGDFGLGFLYASESALAKIERPVVGYYQAPNLDANYPPHYPSGAYRAVDYSYGERTAANMFEISTLVGSSMANLATLDASLAYVQSLGPANIAAHRAPLIKRLQDEVPRLGFTAVTPRASTGGNVTFARKDLAASNLSARLAAAKVNVRIGRDWMRVSPSVYNSMTDVERLLEALR